MKHIEAYVLPHEEAMAREYYGDGWLEAIRECKEAHLPGDCVLCGADQEEA